jgi:HEAT repeat protein
MSRTDTVDSRAIARLVSEAVTDEDEAKAIAALRSSSDAEVILETLSRDRDLEVRGWIPGAAHAVLGDAAIPLIKRMLRDSDADIRGLALDELERIDPALLEPILPMLRKNLASQNEYEVLQVGWRLVERGDVEAIAPLKAFRDRYEAWMWEYKAATVLLLALTAPDEVIPRIREHDHDHMTWLAYAAVLQGTPDAYAALLGCSTDCPDDDCRRMCAFTLERDWSRKNRRPA